ncbi:MAG: hypothetical protein KIS76_19085 [Pyrinomonadaceae bacterium]|nr:hypothetical protein [Pyrinomonadaceae bacterium]
MRYLNNSFSVIWALATCLLLAINVDAQSAEVTVKFKVNQKDVEVRKFDVSIFDPSGTVKLLELETKDNKILVSEKVANYEKFEIHISFDKYKLVLIDAGKNYFDYDWTIDAVDPLPDVDMKVDSNSSMRRLKGMFFVNYNMPNSDGGFVEVVKMYEDCRD